MILGIDPAILLLVALVLAAGAAVQSLVGLGLGLVAAPVVTLLEPGLMPVLLLVLGILLPVLTLAEDRTDIDWRGLAWSLPSRLPGTWAGVLLLAAASERALGLVIGVIVLLGVALTGSRAVVPRTAPNLMAAGFVSGVTGTSSGVGGPPIALVYQSRPGREIRSTLAVYFAVGSTVSLAGLLLAGEVAGATVALGLALAPTMPAGAWVGRRLRTRLPEDRVRRAVLLVCAGSALVLVTRSLA